MQWEHSIWSWKLYWWWQSEQREEHIMPLKTCTSNSKESVISRVKKRGESRLGQEKLITLVFWGAPWEHKMQLSMFYFSGLELENFSIPHWNHHFLRNVLFQSKKNCLLESEHAGLKSFSSKLLFVSNFIASSLFLWASSFLSLAADWYLMV